MKNTIISLMVVALSMMIPFAYASSLNSGNIKPVINTSSVSPPKEKFAFDDFYWKTEVVKQKQTKKKNSPVG
jgi:hypothetical protein